MLNAVGGPPKVRRHVRVRCELSVNPARCAASVSERPSTTAAVAFDALNEVLDAWLLDDWGPRLLRTLWRRRGRAALGSQFEPLYALGRVVIHVANCIRHTTHNTALHVSELKPTKA